jgi:hypothetical protein
MSANRAPDANVPFVDARGRANPIWWRFFARVAGQFSGADAPLMPVDAGGNLSVLGAQAKQQSMSEAQVQEIVQQVLSMLPRAAGNSLETADNGLLSLRNRAAGFNAETGALDLAMIAASRPRPAQLASLQLIQDTLANRPAAADFNDGSVLFIATDNFQMYYVQGGAWTQAYGFMDYNPAGPLLTITPNVAFSGNATIATGITVSAGGAAITGNSAVAGNLNVTAALAGNSITSTTSIAAAGPLSGNTITSASTILAGSSITSTTFMVAGTTMAALSTVTALFGFISGGSTGESNTVPLAKITGGGADGSITFSGGIETAHVDPT